MTNCCIRRGGFAPHHGTSPAARSLCAESSPLALPELSQGQLLAQGAWITSALPGAQQRISPTSPQSHHTTVTILFFLTPFHGAFGLFLKTTQGQNWIALINRKQAEKSGSQNHKIQVSWLHRLWVNPGFSSFLQKGRKREELLQRCFITVRTKYIAGWVPETHREPTVPCRMSFFFYLVITSSALTVKPLNMIKYIYSLTQSSILLWPFLQRIKDKRKPTQYVFIRWFKNTCFKQSSNNFLFLLL